MIKLPLRTARRRAVRALGRKRFRENSLLEIPLRAPRTPRFTVALVGADGAGKTTMARRLERDAPQQPGDLPLKYLYMGVSRQASNRMLPSTWLIWRLKRLSGRGREEGGPPDPNRRRSSSKGQGASGARKTSPLKRAFSQLKEGLYMANLLAEEWFRQLVTTYFQLRGYIVLFDRHFFLDYYAHDIDRRLLTSDHDHADAARSDGRPPSAVRRFHGFLLQHLFPKPDLVILLDAPAEVLFSRKPEGTVALIEGRRQEYWRLKDKVPHFVVVDATLPQDDVAATIISHIRTFQAVGEVRLASAPATAGDADGRPRVQRDTPKEVVAER